MCQFGFSLTVMHVGLKALTVLKFPPWLAAHSRTADIVIWKYQEKLFKDWILFGWWNKYTFHNLLKKWKENIVASTTTPCPILIADGRNSKIPIIIQAKMKIIIILR